MEIEFNVLQVQQAFPQFPLNILIENLRQTRSLNATSINILEGVLTMPNTVEEVPQIENTTNEVPRAGTSSGNSGHVSTEESR